MSLLQKHRGDQHDQRAHFSNYGKGLIVVPDYASIVGSAAQDFSKAGTVDVLIRDDPSSPKYWRDSVSALISRTLSKTFGKPANFILNPYGPHAGTFLPLFDLVLRPSTGQIAVHKAAGLDQPDFTDSVMVAYHVPPEVSRRIAVPGGLPVSDHHITAAYLGKTDQNPRLDALKQAILAYSRRAAPTTATLNGVAAFNPDDEGRTPIVALVNILGGYKQYDALCNELRAQHFMPSLTHEFNPHITLSYVNGAAGLGQRTFANGDGDQPLPPGAIPGSLPRLSFPINSIFLHYGHQVTEFPLRGHAVPGFLDETDPNGPGMEPGFDPNLYGLPEAPVNSSFGEPFNTSINTQPGQFFEAVQLFDAPMLKAAPEKRYTFTVVYKASKPNSVQWDAHNEFTSADELQQAQWQYVRRNDRSIYIQHGLTQLGLSKAGEWVDLVQWPYAVKAELMLPDGSKRTSEIPAGSVYMGAQWMPWSWPFIKSGKIRGFSFGGTARRLTVHI